MANRLVRFTVTPSGGTATNYDYRVDMLTVRYAYDASQYQQLDDTLRNDVRRKRLVFEISGVMESDTASVLSPAQLWDALIGSGTVTFYPLGSGDPSTRVIGDPKHQQLIFGLAGGMRRRKIKMVFGEQQWRANDATHFDDWAELIMTL